MSKSVVPQKLTQEDVQGAWLIMNPEGMHGVPRPDVLRLARLFFPDLSARDFRTILDNRNEVTLDLILEVLNAAPLEGQDHIVEAFKALDPSGSGHADLDLVRSILGKLPGVGEVSDEDMRAVMEEADLDRDGRISFKASQRSLSSMPDEGKE